MYYLSTHRHTHTLTRSHIQVHIQAHTHTITQIYATTYTHMSSSLSTHTKKNFCLPLLFFLSNYEIRHHGLIIVWFIGVEPSWYISTYIMYGKLYSQTHYSNHLILIQSMGTLCGIEIVYNDSQINHTLCGAHILSKSFVSKCFVSNCFYQNTL